ncbi:MAG: nucleotide exchange factor GrpE [candidate division Zixibacteria bacterium]|nr:nucleotide exchange factor GrpE [candidate division Zixibacteria bacterium]
MVSKKKDKELQDAEETQEIEAVSGEAKEKEKKEEDTELNILRERLQKCEEENQELEDRLLRLAAEFDNYKKRTAREFGNLIRAANEDLIVDLLETVDNFCRAVESNEVKANHQSFCKGMEMIYAQLWEVLSSEGLEEIKAVGKKFDPNFHEAVGQIESDKYEEGTVAQEISKGYTLKGKVIKPAKVLVVKGKKEEKEK